MIPREREKFNLFFLDMVLFVGILHTCRVDVDPLFEDQDVCWVFEGI